MLKLLKLIFHCGPELIGPGSFFIPRFSVHERTLFRKH